MMTKKDYAAIATDFAVQMNLIEAELLLAEKSLTGADLAAMKAKWNCAAGNVERLAYSLAATFRIGNPNFDSSRFLKACKVSQ